MINKKGLSTVVTTLIIVLLVLAAIGIIWNPIKNLLTQSTDSFDQAKCFEMDITASKVVAEGTDQTTCLDSDDGITGDCNTTRIADGSSTCVVGTEVGQCGDGDNQLPTGTNYSLTLKRSLKGDESIGAKVIFYSDTENSETLDFPAKLTSTTTVVTRPMETGVENANKVEVYAYYIDETTGEEKICEAGSTFEWTSA